MVLKLDEDEEQLFSNSAERGLGTNSKTTANTESILTYISIPGSSFLGSETDVPKITVDQDVGAITITALMANGVIAPVLLPHNCIVKSVVVEGDSATASWKLERSNGSSEWVMATAALGTTDTSISYNLIENKDYHYFLIVSGFEVDDIIIRAVIQIETRYF